MQGNALNYFTSIWLEHSKEFFFFFIWKGVEL